MLSHSEWVELLSTELHVSWKTANKMYHAIKKIKKENAYRIEKKTQLEEILIKSNHKPKTT